jgi:HSP20 family protein
MAQLTHRRGSLPATRTFDPFELMHEMLNWEPLRELGTPGRGTTASPTYFVPFDVKETADAYVFRADLPGVAEEQVEIQLTGNRLTISGNREEEKREENERFFSYERSHGTFTRLFTLPEGIDAENVQADLKNGVLEVRVPKKPEVQPKKISLKPGTQSGQAQGKA